jgi:hypothetical protein
MNSPVITHSNYFEYARSMYGDRREARLRHQMAFLYNGIDFKGKRVLDIGGGAGEHTFFAVASGAASVLTIEPEGDGGHDNMHEIYEQWRAALGADNTRLINTTIQNYTECGALYDIVLIQDAINHFDEPACIDLKHSASSRATYAAIFRDIAAWITPGGLLVMSDCSSNNLFPLFGFRNPIDPAIEWHKHQPPEVWLGLAEEAGLKRQTLRWSSPARFGSVGAAVFGNRLGAFVFTSHFLITMLKPI